MTKGAQARQTVPMASISVGDDTVPYFPVTFWRGQTKWVGEVLVGDVILLRDVDIKSYRDKLSGTGSFRSIFKIVHRSSGDVPVDPDAMASVDEVGDRDRLMQVLGWAQQQSGFENFKRRRKS
ncbi:Shieldin complex subunit 2 [Rhizophlyctis rosea]|uniref:Shieldin complex subunit 2 n=1 Tax=Rhizophlyctis rosea TaxID=64517 RepID=A0AAD5X0K9_9FUNG|nr:Shieldin complex subunit 2 [Rhizophlyctis rosea]